jgi:GT2 family glycosyltransferase
VASIIVPCWNQWEFTRLCLESLFCNTRSPWELIAIDNGSTDRTGDELAAIHRAAPVPVTLIRNSRNIGFPAAINQGFQVASGEYLVLLNNDAVVTEAWLDHLIALASVGKGTTNEVVGGELGLGGSCKRGTGTAKTRSQSPFCKRAEGTIGLAGPMSNYAAPPQLVEAVPYRDMDGMHAFARRWRDEHRGKWFTVPKLSGFCMLVTRAVYDAIGGMDERFGLGLFDDDDLAERARRAGFELAVAHDLFVHHFGSRTFVGNRINAEALLEQNARRFAAKWGRAEPHSRRVLLQPWSVDTGQWTHNSGRPAVGRSAATLPVPGDPRRMCAEGDEPITANASLPQSTVDRPGPKARVSLTMIVKDEQENLPKALGSVQGLFDEIIVVSTGSTDRTVEIARSFGARVFDFVRVDDFGAARNAALARATRREMERMMEEQAQRMNQTPDER